MTTSRDAADAPLAGSEAEARFRATFEQAAVGIAHVGPDGRWLRVNQRLCDILGYARDDLLQLTFQDITHPDDLAADFGRVQQTLAGKLATYAVEKRYLRKDGSIVWINQTASLVRGEDGEPQYLIAVIEDIDARKRAEAERAGALEALRESESRLALAVDAAGAGTWSFDFTTGRFRGSERMGALLGLPPGRGEAPLEEWKKRVHPDDLPRVLAEFEAVSRGEGDYDSEYRVLCPDGSICWIGARGILSRDGRGRPLRAAGIALDITDRKRAEESLRESEERFRVAARLVSEHIYEWDMHSNEARWFGDLAGALGYTEDELPASLNSFLRIVHRDDRRRLLAAISQALETGEGYQDEFRFVCKDGVVRHFTDCVVILRAEDGTPRKWLGVNTDITAHKRAEERLAADLRHERHVAETLQRALLYFAPEHSFPGIAVAPNYEAALDEALVGGDFYDAFALDEGRVALLIGDVSGKGLAAATRTAEVRYTLRALLREGADAPEAVSRVNDLLCDARRLGDHGRESLVVMSLIVVETATGEATCVVAGMEPPLLVHPDGSAEPIDAGGFPLAIIEDRPYQPVRFCLAPGDTLVLVTDGITEARNRRGEFLYYEGLIEMSKRLVTPDVSLRESAQSILDHTHLFAGGPLQDDACILLARREIPDDPS